MRTQIDVDGLNIVYTAHTNEAVKVAYICTVEIFTNMFDLNPKEEICLV